MTATILVIREEEKKKLEHYAYDGGASGGFQNLCKKLLRRVVASPDQVEAAIADVERDEKGLFG
jgi:hypothetical protein